MKAKYTLIKLAALTKAMTPVLDNPRFNRCSVEVRRLWVENRMEFFPLATRNSSRCFCQISLEELINAYEMLPNADEIEVPVRAEWVKKWGNTFPMLKTGKTHYALPEINVDARVITIQEYGKQVSPGRQQIIPEVVFKTCRKRAKSFHEIMVQAA